MLSRSMHLHVLSIAMAFGAALATPAAATITVYTDENAFFITSHAPIVATFNLRPSGNTGPFAEGGIGFAAHAPLNNLFLVTDPCGPPDLGLTGNGADDIDITVPEKTQSMGFNVCTNSFAPPTVTVLDMDGGVLLSYTLTQGPSSAGFVGFISDVPIGAVRWQAYGGETENTTIDNVRFRVPGAAVRGINLSWDDCGTFGTLQKNFACDTNIGTNRMVASVVAGVPMPQLNGQSTVIDMQTNRASLSNWWQLASGGCRGTTLISAGFDFTANVNCRDPWLGLAAGGINYTAGYAGPNRARIKTVCAIPGNVAINGTDEYYVCRVLFFNSRTVGTGSCAGCTDGVCFVLNQIQLTQPLGVGDAGLSIPIVRNYVQWQGTSFGSAPFGGGAGCPGATPVRVRTWGSLKALYR